MSVAENVFLAGHNVPAFANKRKLVEYGPPLSWRRWASTTSILRAGVDRLSVGEQHLVEVARLIAHDPRVLILDEPTAALGEQDSIRILDMVGRLSERGKSIIYVSHRLDEIFKITDRITVLRDGESQTPRTADSLNVSSLVELMLGRELENMFPERRPRGHGEPLMQVRGLWPDGLLEPVNFDIYPGEILGLAGQLGSGSGEILAAMGGALKTRSGVHWRCRDREFLPSSPKGGDRRSHRLLLR